MLFCHLARTVSVVHVRQNIRMYAPNLVKSHQDCRASLETGPPSGMTQFPSARRRYPSISAPFMLLISLSDPRERPSFMAVSLTLKEKVNCFFVIFTIDWVLGIVDTSESSDVRV